MANKRHPVTLRFRSKDLEAAFARSATGSLATNRTALLLAAVVYAGFSAADRWMTVGATAPLALIRAGVCVVLLLAWSATYSRRAQRALTGVLSTSVLVMGFGILAILAVAQGDPRHYYMGALFPIIIFAHGLVRLPFVYATVSCWIVTIAYVAMDALLLDTPSHSLLTHTFLLSAANGFGMLASYARESATRTGFLQRARLRRQRRVLEQTLARKQEMARALERSEQKYRQLLEAMNEGLLTVDAEGWITWISDSLCQMSGYTRDELIGHHPTEFLDEAGKRLFVDEFAKRREGKSDRYALDWMRKDGSRLAALVSPHAFYSRAGVFTGSTTVVSDITQLRDAQEALARSERQFRELVTYASSIILRWDADGTIRFINPFGSRFFGYDESDLCGHNVIGTVVPATDSSGNDLAGMIRDITVHPERYLYNENEVRGRNGQRYWVMWTNRAITDGTGRVAEVLSIGTDVTELKRAREAVAHQRDELAELNAFIRRTFGRYVSEEVVRSLLESPDGVKVGGCRSTVSVLVADIRGFSSICERLTPESVVALLNRYLETMTAVIERYQGTLDEIVGDGMLVIFGAPTWGEDHAERAVACAVAMQLAMAEVNTANALNDLPAIEIGIGINTGEVIVGSIGSMKRAKYGVVGRTVNLAARIESYTVGGQILASAETCRAAGPILVVDNRIRAEPKGAKGPIHLCEITGIRGRHDLTLPPREDRLVVLDPELPCEYVVLEEKFVGRTVFRGQIVALSEREAELECDAPLAQLSNLKLLILDDEGNQIQGDLYAKVVRQSGEDPLRYGMRFTSVSPAARSLITRFLAGTWLPNAPALAAH